MRRCTHWAASSSPPLPPPLPTSRALLGRQMGDGDGLHATLASQNKALFPPVSVFLSSFPPWPAVAACSVQPAGSKQQQQQLASFSPPLYIVPKAAGDPATPHPAGRAHGIGTVRRVVPAATQRWTHHRWRT